MSENNPWEPGLRRAIEWVDHYLSQKHTFKAETEAVLRELRYRLVYERQNGPSSAGPPPTPPEAS